MSRRRVSMACAFLMVVLVVVGAVVALAVGSRRTSTWAETRDRPQASVAVVRGDLVRTRSLGGAVGFGDPVIVSGLGSGVITWLPSVGRTVRRGQQLYRVDDAPVTAFYGSIPLYRTLTRPAKGARTPSLTGRDVDLVARNLKKLGFWDGATSDVSYSGYFVGAVKQWQRTIGAPPTGVIEPGSIVTTHSPVRVSSVLTRVDTPAAQDVLKITETAKVITLKAPTSLVDALAPGAAVQVTLADGTSVATTIATIGVASAAEGEQQPTVPVEVVPSRPADLVRAAPGPVTATVRTATRRGVLHVPAKALLALAGGGYALELTDHRLVPVGIGLIVDGEVEVSGVAPGARVVVAR